MPPPLIPPKGGRRIKGIRRFLLSHQKTEYCLLLIPDFFQIGNVNRNFKRDIWDIYGLIYNLLVMEKDAK